MEAWSDGLKRLPAQFHADRAELLGLLRKNAILHESPTQPILSRDGSTARWMLELAAGDAHAARRGAGRPLRP